MKKISIKNVQRLIIYRNILRNLSYEGITDIHSKKIAELSSFSPEQVRHDLMLLDYCGTPTKGYNVQELEYQIGELLDDPVGQSIAVVGLGNLGTSLIDYCWWRYQNLAGIYGFDHDHKKIKKSSKFGKCYHINSLEEIIKQENINIAIISVPPDDTQKVADRLVAAGIKGILNYTPVRLNLPEDVYVEDVDLLLALDKVAFISRNNGGICKKLMIKKS